MWGLAIEICGDSWPITMERNGDRIELVPAFQTRDLQLAASNERQRTFKY